MEKVGRSSRVLKYVMSAGKTGQNPTKKRSLCVINEHFEEDIGTCLMKLKVEGIQSVCLTATVIRLQ
jgi:hypothetical protein